MIGTTRLTARLIFCAAASLAVLTSASAPAHAQIAAALGRPLPVSSDPIGNVTVRVVAGSPSNPAAGVDVTLMLGDTPRVARTDASGRATFSAVPAGSSAVVKIDGPSGELASNPFEMPSAGGVRLLMSTTGTFGPPGGAGGGGEATGGAAGGGGGAPPSLRQRSGGVIGSPGSAADSLGIRLSYDDPADPTPPKDQAVYLVAYGSDDKIVVTKQATNAEGRVKFTGLDVSGGTSYFAMTMLPRGATFDRLLSGPVILPGGTGLAMVLSADKRTSTAPAIDEVLSVQHLEGAAPPAGSVVVEVQGDGEGNANVSLHDATTGTQLVTAPVGAPMIDPATVSAKADFSTRGDLPAHTLDVIVVGPEGDATGDVEVAIQLASVTASPFATTPVAPGIILGKTTSSGPLRLGNLPVGKLVTVVKIAGKEVRSEPFDVTATGGAQRFVAQWPRAWPAARLDTAALPAGQVVYAETTMHGNRYRSLPFQLAPDRGARTTLLVVDRVMFQFSLTSSFDEDFFVFRGRFALSNNSWFPYKSSDDGLLVPLPTGFKGGQVGEEDAADISPVQGSGLRVLRPLAPGVKQFLAGWSMAAKDGEVLWDLELPLGAVQSGMEIMQLPGMTVELPSSVQGHTVTVAKGAFFVLPEISIAPRQRMVMTIRGLPAAPSWKLWAPRVAGVTVLLILIGGLGFAFARGGAEAVAPAGTAPTSRKAAAAKQAKIDALMDELVALEDEPDSPRRAEVMAQLESLWPATGAAAGKASGKAS